MALPLIEFRDILQNLKEQFVIDMNEIIGAAHILGSNPHYVTLDENGLFHVHASGTIEECLIALDKHIEKLERINKQKKGMV